MISEQEILSLRECSRRLPAQMATLAKHVKAGRLKAMVKDGRYFVELSDLLDFADRRAKGLLPKAGRPKGKADDMIKLTVKEN